MFRRRKKRETDVVGLSFLDCICCGFGAVLLLFVLTTGKRANENRGQVDDAREIIQRLASDIEAEEARAQRLERSIDEQSTRIAQVMVQRKSLEEQVQDRAKTLSLLLDRTSQLEDELKQLMDEAEHLPTVEEMPPLPIPNPDRRQYLTNFSMEGERVLFLVEAAGSMLDLTVEGAVTKVLQPPEVRREARKWQHTLEIVRWFIANIRPGSNYQIAFFNRDVFTVLEDVPLGDWMDPLDPGTTDRVLDALHSVTPGGGANFERAMIRINEMEELPDNIIFVTDGLPTLADSVPSGQVIEERVRINMLMAARRVRPQVPFNIILLPFEGDPTAAVLFWSWSMYTNGALVCPAPDWPSTSQRRTAEIPET